MKNSNPIVNENTSAVNALSVIIGDTTKTETGTRKANKRRAAVYTLHNDKRISDFAAAFLMEESKRAVYRSLKTIYQKSASPVVLQLMRECAELMGDTASFENWITSIYGAEMVTAKTHSKTRDAKTGRMLACREYTTFQFTETGKILDDGIENNLNLDVYDLVNTAYLAYLELVNIGAVIDYRDIKRNRGYVYKRVNQEIYANKKSINETEQYNKYCIVTDDNGNETIFTGAHIDRYVRVDTDAALAVILEQIEKVSSKQANIRAAVKTFKLFAIDGYSKVEIAAMLGVNEKQVRRHIELVKRIADNAETRNALCELLNA